MIVPMSKITVLGLASQKEALLKQLMLLNCVEITDRSDVSEFLSSEELEKYQRREGQDIRYSEMRQLAKNALDILEEYAPSQKRKGLFYQKRLVKEEAFSQVLMEEGSAFGAAQRIDALGRELNRLQNEKNQFNNQLENLKPWEKLPIPLDSRGTRTTKCYAGTLMKSTSLDELKQELDALELTSFDTIYETSESFYVYLVFHRSVEREIKELLRKYSFNRVRFDRHKGTYSDAAGAIKKQIAEQEKQQMSVLEEIASYRGAKEQIQLLYDYLTYLIDRENASERLFLTQNMYVLDGYLPQEKGEEVKSQLTDQFTAAVRLSAVEPEDEKVPTLLRNNRLVQPYETITEMYSTPNYREIDPNAMMAPFYFIFFGMMVSDAGYGLLTALACFFVLWKYKPEGMMGRMLTMIGFGGISTMFWGIMFGGYFGDTITVLSDGAFYIPPVLFNPLDDPMTLLIISFGLGILHIFVGIGAKVYLCMKRKLFAEGVAHLSWILIIGGLVCLLAGPLMEMPAAGEIGKWIAVAGVIALILTNGWEEKNLFKKLFKGISGLMDITGYFSDILSYSRLLALGLSTGVIAMVVNIMGSMAGREWYGWILFAAVFVLGHSLNLAINLLGAYVHTSRLQYVEFFGKFFEGGGRAFSPLHIRTKYTRFTKAVK